MASELLKTKALSARIKEPKVRDFDFGLNLTSVESLIPDLPQPKPQELLDIQEQSRKGRLLDSLNKIGGGLEDSSLDFINRENFENGTIVKTPEQYRKNLLTKKRYYEKQKADPNFRLDKTLKDKINLIENAKRTFAENPGLKEAHINNLYRKENGKFIRRNQPLRPFAEVFADFGITPSMAKEFSSIIRKELKADGSLGTAKESAVQEKRNETIKKGKANAGPTSEPINKKLKNLKKTENSKLINLLKENPNKLVSSIRSNPDLMNQLESVFDSQKGVIEKVKISDDEIKKLVNNGFYSEEHKTPVQTGKKNIEFPTNKGFVTKQTNSKVLAPMNKWLNTGNNYKLVDGEVKDPKLKNLENWLTQNKIRTKVEGAKGYFGDKSLKSIPAEKAIERQFDLLKTKPLPESAPAKNKIYGVKNAKQILKMAKPALRATPYVVAGEVALAAPFALSDYAAGKTGKRILGNATFGIFGETEKEEIKEAAGPRGFASQTLKDISKRLPILEQQYKSLNDENDPGGLNRKKYENIHNVLGKKYTDAYNLFLDEEGEFDKELYNQAGNNYTAAINQINRLDTMRAEERPDELTGLESYDTEMAEGGRIGYSNGSDGTALAIEESLEAFKRYLEAGGKLGYKDFISLGNEGVSKFFNKGGRVSFGSGTGPAPVRIIYFIMDRLRNLKNSTFENYNQVRMYGEQKGIKELLEPYKNIPNKNRVTSAIDDAEELKKFMPDEYKPILNEIIDDTKQFKFKTAHDKQQALEKALPKELKFENLPEEMFPMPNPENPNFIMPYGYPDKNPFQKSRITTRTEADKFTGKGTRKTYDTFNEKTKQYQEPSKNTLISEEPIGEELESIIRDLDKGDLQ